MMPYRLADRSYQPVLKDAGASPLTTAAASVFTGAVVGPCVETGAK